MPDKYRPLLLWVDEDGLVFKTQLDKHGVITVKENMVKEAERLFAIVNRKVGELEGDFIKTKFIAEPPLSEEEADLLELSAAYKTRR
jgi:hypothetical protein